jgi:predicted transcriptional regulator
MEKKTMNIVTLEVATLNEVKRRTQDAFKGKKQGSRISFETVDLLFKVLTAKRRELIHAMIGAGAMTIREAARQVNRDVKAVHGDVHALLDAGILQTTANRRVIVPFDAVHVDFTMNAQSRAA